MSSLHVNISHNQIMELSLNHSDGSGGRLEAGELLRYLIH